ncbi:hypothetical protein B0H66DRAFT_627104 [Apodospora peruviana]|uniref:Uncharacterized protein n=1 Tax=Apodospora peruviana TaxID=516989 RepID=A0AAE0HX45_9PEZI|nr:hypothetical protein B0H66DRAFT_627104 [Apodospora peruviana]
MTRRTNIASREPISAKILLQPMQQLGLDVMGIASAMGKAFVIMPWGAGVNGDDVEFVLGSSATRGRGDGTLDLQYWPIGLFLLDFGQCDRVNFSDDVDDVYQAFKGAMKSPEVYAAFKEVYMGAGQTILEQRNLENKFHLEDFMREYEEYAEDFLLSLGHDTSKESASTIDPRYLYFPGTAHISHCSTSY